MGRNPTVAELGHPGPGPLLIEWMGGGCSHLKVSLSSLSWLLVRLGSAPDGLSRLLECPHDMAAGLPQSE